MATNRKVVFANGEIYHVFNRGVEKRQTFIAKREFARGIDTLAYYRFANLPFRFSRFIRLDSEAQGFALKNLTDENKQVEILCYCLMPNHFHFLLKQTKDNGISRFVANFTNSYTKYFNTKHDRVGPLFQGLFKAVHIDNDEQLIHVSRYIHLNPVTSFLVRAEELVEYEWSSYPEYLKPGSSDLVDKKLIMSFFSNSNKYEQFVLDHVDYAKNLERIKHLIFD